MILPPFGIRPLEGPQSLIFNAGFSIHCCLDKLPLVDVAIANGGAGKVAGFEHRISQVGVGDHQMFKVALVKARCFFCAEAVGQKTFTEVDLVERSIIQLSIF